MVHKVSAASRMKVHLCKRQLLSRTRICKTFLLVWKLVKTVYKYPLHYTEHTLSKWIFSKRHMSDTWMTAYMSYHRYCSYKYIYKTDQIKRKNTTFLATSWWNINKGEKKKNYYDSFLVPLILFLKKWKSLKFHWFSP